MMNVLDLNDKGHEVGVVFESEGCKLVLHYDENKNEKFEKLKELKLIASICKVCAQGMGALESAEHRLFLGERRSRGYQISLDESRHVLRVLSPLSEDRGRAGCGIGEEP